MSIDAAASFTPQLSNRHEAIFFLGWVSTWGVQKGFKNGGSVLEKNAPNKPSKEFQALQRVFFQDLGWHLLSRQSVERLRVVGSGKRLPPHSLSRRGLPCPTFPVMSARHPLQKGIISPIFLTFNEPQYHHVQYHAF